MQLPTVVLFLISSSRIHHHCTQIGLQQFHLNMSRPSSSSSSQPSSSLTTATTTTSTTDALTFLSQICGKLKRIKRTGWIRHKVPLPESDSDHMHRCAMCALLLTSQPPDPKDDYTYTLPEYQKFHPSLINSSKLIKMAMTHDLCESIAGDITPFCDANVVNSKHDNEKEAMKEIRNVVGDPLGLELYELWKEYEEQETIEALYCKDIDKFEMVMQAYEYELEHLAFKKDCNENENDDGGIEDESNKYTITPLRTFFITTNNKMKSPLFRRLDAELRQKREALMKERGWEVTQEERQNY